MDILTIRDNLKNTIADKELLLVTYDDPAVGEYHKLVRYAMSQMLTSNIRELKTILADVELYCNQIKD